jgi:hypothetical protein
VALALAACTSQPSTPEPSAPSSPVAASQTPAPTPTPSPTQTVQRSLLSGRVGATDGRVLVVKMDNTPRSEPHAGLEDADVVYLEEVEGGLSRYAAVFSSKMPKTVGPIRSARISDIELLRQYGKVAFAYSGVQEKMLPVLAAADLFDVSADKGGTGYRRDPGWRPPDNLFGDPQVLLKRAAGSVTATDVGFTFDDAVPAGGRAVKTVTTGFPATKVTFTWSGTDHRWLAAMNGRATRSTTGDQLGGTTVIIQYCTVTRSIYHDVNDNYTPLTRSVGSGTALVLRDGRAYTVQWSRASAADGTQWTMNGQPFPLAAGQVWVLLVNKTRPATVS